ncbi:MAG: hypothetical protein RI897_1392 [Verrucomicrobiota bacterium]
MDHIDTEGRGDGDEEGDDDDDGGVDIHEAADGEEEEVQEEEEGPFGFDVSGDPFGGLVGDHFPGEVVSEAEGDAEDEEDTSDEEAAFGHDAGDIAEEFEVFIDECFDDEGVGGGDGGGFDRGGEATEEGGEGDDGKEEFPDGAADGGDGLTEAERGAGFFFPWGDEDAPGGGHGDEEHSGEEAALEDFVYADLGSGGVTGDDGVEDGWEAWGEEEAEGACGGEEAEGVSF